MALVLVGGGARSGKSRWALDRARKRGTRLVYIATAEALDEEMSIRIARHRSERGDEFVTVEAPLDLAGAIRSLACDAVVVDCLTLWLSNTMSMPDKTDETIAAARESTAEVIIVTNEVGSGIVPENALAREFRDRAGRMNQQFAEAADEVYWMVFGQPLRVK
ncbi:MAG: bifunctional adenosylcobinamide kinase/adenosylcobinamide-phosphate guanylyltransferase [Acidobacteriia bacterium]|jgi:adenosylcobinamide kinase/adenosylcobinamide-phosphate guanylyltransferase|nr:bifunctional adenosylcobinamide kinase/adenosylcobinamide-phosphate guanylyltransferase [Terriglobia bacterium]